jgi:methylglutaconyl-CoA hydratase
LAKKGQNVLIFLTLHKKSTMKTQKSEGLLQTTLQNKIATITFGHPASNSFPSGLLAKFTSEIQNLGHNPDVSVIVIQSEGTGTFCAGASFDELMAITNQDQGTQFFSGFANLINIMRSCPKIIIGRIQGKAVGGGVGIASACDYALATHDASIKLSEFAIGIGPFVIEPAVSRKIGKTAFATLTLDAQNWKTATWAQDKGLYASVFATITDLDRGVLEIATRLASYNPEALLEMKKIFWENTQNWETLLPERAQISGKLVLSDFAKKALQEFKK